MTETKLGSTELYWVQAGSYWGYSTGDLSTRLSTLLTLHTAIESRRFILMETHWDEAKAYMYIDDSDPTVFIR